MSEEPTREEAGVHPLSRRLQFLDSKEVRSRITFALGVTFLALLVFDFAIDRHAYLEMEKVKGFYGLWGFVSFAFVVLAGWPLRRLLSRSETYYEEGDKGV